jgi:hypothetical protein
MDQILSMTIRTTGIQFLETLHILGNSKNIDTIQSRIEFLREILETLRTNSIHPDYNYFVQQSIDDYSVRYPNRQISTADLDKINNPRNLEIDEYSAAILVNGLQRYYDDAITEIDYLKSVSARDKRISKIIQSVLTTKRAFDLKYSEFNFYQKYSIVIDQFLAKIKQVHERNLSHHLYSNNEQSTATIMEAPLENELMVDVTYSQIVSFSMQQNHIPVIRKFTLINNTGKDIQNININMSIEIEASTPKSTNISIIKNTESFDVNNFDINLSAKFLSELTERISSCFQLTIQSGSERLYQKQFPIEILAYDQWQGALVLPELISSFVTPNNPLLSKIISRASEILNDWTSNPSLDEYQSKNPDRVKKQMAAIFESIRDLKIVYCTPPASFEESGQRVRMIDTIMDQKLSTCLDLSLLYASCLEAIGINSILIFIKGHAFVGAWLIDDTFPDAVNDDYTLITKRTAEGINEILLVESTCMNLGNNVSFDEAVKSANYHLVKSDDFLLFIDVKRSRFSGIRPFPQRIKTQSGWEFSEEKQSSLDISAPEELQQQTYMPIQIEREFTKQQLWERKLLDLSLRNNLLNTRITKSTIQLISVDLHKLEDALSADEEFQLLSKPGDWDNPLRMAGVYQSVNQTDPIIDLVRNELSQKRLRAYLSENDLIQGLSNLYRSARLSLEENGANTLYLCLGLLKWYETRASEQPRFAPILLLPVEITRKSALKGFVLRSREEEAVLNITLLEMLRQDFKINISGLDPLPKDESGVDLKSVFNIFRQVIKVQDRWDVEEQAIIGIFSFNKFIMWNDIHNNAEKLIQNKIVSSLISGQAKWDVEENQFSDEDLDKKYHPSELILPISADSSQLEAICAANKNANFVLHGPPGTGKSQTITNIIANSLYNGKKVLFVAEKMAALSVVQRRLESIGLAPFCLELHSKKTKRSALLEQLKRATEVKRRVKQENYFLEAERIKNVREELNDYVEALHKKYHFGLSLFDAFSKVGTCPEFKHSFQFDQDVISSLKEEKINKWSEIAGELRAAAEMCGHPHNHPLKCIRTLTYSTNVKSNVGALLDNYAVILKKLKDSLVKIKRITGIDIQISNKSQISAIDKICNQIISAIDLPASLFSINDFESLNLFIRISENGIKRNIYRDSLLNLFDKGILNVDAQRLKSEWKQTYETWFLPRLIKQNKIIQSIKSLSFNKKIDQEKILRTFNEIIEYNEEQSKINLQSGFIAPILGHRWNGGDCDWKEIKQITEDIIKLNQFLLECLLDPAKAELVKHSLINNIQPGIKVFVTTHGHDLLNFSKILNELNTVESKLKDLLLIDSENLEVVHEEYIENLTYYSDLWKNNLDSLRDWVTWNQIKEKALEEGLKPLIDNIENCNIEVSQIEEFFNKQLYQSCAEYIIEQDKRLSSFNGKIFEEKIRKFRELSKAFEKITKDELFDRLAAKIPIFTKEAAQSSEIGILQRNIRNGGRGMSIRKFFDTIPSLITRLCPCMLMSPISVAQFIDINNFKFDLIIFDEASQMPTSEAVSAIARGINVIVVGDPKQMPPTNFFSTNNIDDENIEKEDLESILDDCLALSMPSKHLLWHYRSRHESLINFSNAQYYENSLLTFPSPDDLVSKVNFVHVPGYYDRGKSRQNHFEAKAVIEEVIRRLSDPVLSKKSIGIVTFSSVQQILIEDMLNEAFKQRPDLEELATESLEPVFIKNLENVQGDERDIILFSVGYGPDKDNKIYLNFGPLNREGGWRRLNVAVSRARYEMLVYSSLKADQIDITRTAAKGVSGLKAFLEFAEKGKKSSTMINPNGIPEETGITLNLKKQLEKEGFQVNTNIGSSDFKIDLGIMNPLIPSEYLLGVITDGPNYKELKTAKDREIIQNEVLHNLGWKTHKVWSCDWWDNRSKVINDIKFSLENDINDNSQIEKKVPEVLNSNPAQTQTSQILNINTSGSKYRESYRICELPIYNVSGQFDILNSKAFKDSVANDLMTILQKEAPISKALLCRRILQAWSISRLGSRIETFFDMLFKQMNLSHTQGRQRFFWNINQDPAFFIKYRVSDLETHKRDALDISPEEVSNAVHEVLENNISLSKTDLVKESAKLFGYNRIGGNVELSMMDGVIKAAERGFAIIEDERIFLKEQ